MMRHVWFFLVTMVFFVVTVYFGLSMAADERAAAGPTPASTVAEDLEVVQLEGRVTCVVWARIPLMECWGS